LKNKFEKQLLEYIYERFQLLKKDVNYKLYYLIFSSLEEIHALHKLVCGEHEIYDEEVEVMKYQFSMELVKRWGLFMFINPDLKLKRESIDKPYVKPGSPLAKAIYAFGICRDSELLGKPKSKIKTSLRVKEMDEQVAKALCYGLSKMAERFGKTRYRQFGRILGIDKKTSKKWIEEYEKLSENDRNILLEEAFSNRKFPAKDVLELNSRRLTSFHKVENIIAVSGSHLRTAKRIG